MVEDDRKIMNREGERLIERVKKEIEGGVEIRGEGMLRIKYRVEKKMDMVVLMVNGEEDERYKGKERWIFEEVRIKRIIMKEL